MNFKYKESKDLIEAVKKAGKEVLKVYGLGVILTFVLIGVLAPGQGVEDYVKSARENIEENNYSEAIESYNNALEDWGSEEDYEFDKTVIERELEEAEENHLNVLISEIEESLTEKNLETAETKLEEAQNISPEDEKVVSLENELVLLMNKQEADNYLDQAEEYIADGEYEKATEEINNAAEVVDEYDRVVEVRNTAREEFENIVDIKLDNAEEELDEWNLDKAEEHIASAGSLLPDSERVKGVRENLKEKENIISDIGEKPENSSWDGSVRPVKEYLKERLRDPDSVEYMEWSPVHLAYLNGEPVWRVRGKYRAKNAFGGYVIEEKLFYMRHSQVVAFEDF